jgi:hypothetical protein
MSHRTIARTVCAAAVGLGAVIPAVGTFAIPALAAGTPGSATALAPAAVAPPVAALAADCCQASIQGLPSRFAIGGQPDQFSVSFHNTSQQSFSSFTVVLSFAGNNLDGNQITLKRLAQGGSWQSVRVSRRNGTLSGTDGRFRLGQPLPPGGSTTFTYQLSFDNGTRPTQVQFGVAIDGRAGFRGGDGGTELAKAGAQFAVGTAAAPPTPKATPTPTTASAPPSVAQSAPAQDAGPGGPPVTPGDASNNSSGSSVIWIAYVIGALLLLGGIAAIGTLVWRRQSDTSEDGWDEDGTALQRGGMPVYPAPMAYPTQPLPAQPSDYGPPGYGPEPAYGADPYAADPTYGGPAYVPPAGPPLGPPPVGPPPVGPPRRQGGGRHSAG